MLKWVYEFNQEKLLALQTEQYKITPADVLILHSVVNSVCSIKMQTIFENNRVYVWIDHSHLLESLPILNIGARQFNGLIKKYKELRLIETKTIANHNLRGSKSFIALSDNLIDCLSDTATKNYQEKLDACTDSKQMKNISSKNRPDAKNCMSSNTQYSKNKELSKDNSKNSKNSFFKSSSKKRSAKFTYQDCLTCIDNFTNDESLKSALRDYLNYRLSIMKEKPMKLVQWKSMLVTLEKALEKSSAGVTMEDIVRRAIERGYASFFAINNSWSNYSGAKNKSWESGVSSEQRTQEEKEADKAFLDDLAARGKKVVF